MCWWRAVVLLVVVVAVVWCEVVCMCVREDMRRGAEW